MKPDVRPGIIVFDENNFIFACGNNIVIQTHKTNPETKT